MHRLLRFAPIALLAGAYASAVAAPTLAPSSFVVTIRDARGVPVRDAVVSIAPSAGLSGAPIRFPWPARMVQRDIAFNPGTLIVAKGSDVTFPNQDKVRHHVYSFSKPARFEIELYGREQARSQRFAIAGTVALGCNIHDRMQGYIRVVDTPFAGKTDEYGRVRIDGMPAGAARVTVWHPRQRSPANESSYDVQLPAGGTADKNMTMALRT